MGYVIHPGRPEKMSWQDFVRPHTVGQLAFDDPTGFESRSTPIGVGREFGEFRIHLGQYNSAPEKNAKRIERRGLPVVAVRMTHPNTVVASVTALALWTHMLFRQKNLAVEVIIDRVRYEGAYKFLRFHEERESRGKQMRYTPEGLLAMRAAYAAMVERSLIVSGET